MDTTSQPTQEPLLTEEAVPRGFRFAAVCAGIKASGNPDFACAVSEHSASAAAMFTSNKVIAAPLIVGQRNLEHGQHRIRALIVNAGNANCATGEAGIQAVRRVCDVAGEVLGCDGCEVFPSSTGIIGVPLPAEKLLAALPSLRERLGGSASHVGEMARAIMTTDTRSKIASASFAVEERTVRLLGIAKGAGMICPRLASGIPTAPHATMLVYVFTDAAIEPPTAGSLLHDSVETTFNRISIDGDTSTNDTVLLLANGASGVRIEAGVDHPAGSGVEHRASTTFTGEEPSGLFASALHAICLSLAKQIVADGEGVEHVVELNVCGALSDADALQVARSIAHSPLVKTAWAGRDPNWGRILAAVGNAGVPINPALVDIRLGEMEICRGGGVSPQFDKAAAHRYLQRHDLSIRVDLRLGQGACRFWTTDLTAEYVSINADYTT